MGTKKLKFITKQNLIRFLNNLSRNHEVLSAAGNIDYFWQEYRGEFQFTQYRSITSIRQFFIPSQECLSRYFTAQQKQKKPFCIVGAKNCDLTSLIIQDAVFLEKEPDSTYQFMRENNLIISCDCTSFKRVCFCLALEINPYPEKLFDLNLSQLKGGFLVEIGSPKGAKTVDGDSALFERVHDEYIVEREEKRKEVVEGLLRQLRPQRMPPRESLYQLIKNGYENGVWPQEALRCVECGACIMNCPTCHCFLLFDAKDEKGYLRGRIWDGCQYKNFTRVAGGANPLKLRQERLRNRYIKKFEFFTDKINFYACTGCGRCIECCPAKIDLREIFKTLALEKIKAQ